MVYSAGRLTIYAELDPLADGRRDPVLGDAHVRAHVQPGNFVQLQNFALDARHYMERKKRERRERKDE